MPEVNIDLTEISTLTNDCYYKSYVENQHRYLILYGGA